MPANESKLLIVRPNSDFHLATGRVGAIVSFAVPSDYLESFAGGVIGEVLDRPGGDTCLLQLTAVGLRPIRAALIAAAHLEPADWQRQSSWIRDEITAGIIDLLFQNGGFSFKIKPGGRYRLAAVGSEIKRCGHTEKISEIMTRFVFFDAGHFARDYRRMFGERPRDTFRARAG